ADTIKHPSVVWSSDNSGVATVSAFGLVTAVGNGSAHAVATTGGLSAQVTVSVAQAAAQLIKAGGDGQTGVVRATLPSAVTFAATAGGGTVSGGATQTDGNGVATVGRWTLGPGAGENTLTATVAGSGITGNPVTFTATAVQPSAPASVSAGPGDGQTGLTGYALNIAPAVVVRDAASLPVPNVAVTFAVASGGGSVTGANATTGADGVATVGSWTVQLGVNTLTATASGSGITGNPVTLAATGVSAAYHIDVRYLTAVTPAQLQAFESAAAQRQRALDGGGP